LMADVPKIAVTAMDLLAALSHRNAMRFGVIKTILARLEIPLAPGSDDFQLRRQRLVRQFEAHLIVAFSSASVSDGVRTLAQRHLNLVLGNHRPSQRCSEQIFM